MLVGELFSGAGGMVLGAQQAGFDHAWCVDWSMDACETLRMNYNTTEVKKVICNRIESCDIHGLPRVDGLAFGFPCNDFSIIGARKGVDGDYGPLWIWGILTLKIHQPMFFVAENVGGLLSMEVYNQIKNAMKDVGYDIFPHVYRFEGYGVPQTRHRIIIVGFRKDLNVRFQHPEFTHFERKETTLFESREKFISASEAIADIPDGTPDHEKTKHSASVVERLKYIKPGENSQTADMPEHLRIKSIGYSQVYRRLKPDRPSYTIMTGIGGGNHLYHYDEPRALTNRECARLQTFPDDYLFYGNKSSVRKQIGNAVPPLGAKVIFEAVKEEICPKTMMGVLCNK